MPVVNLSGLSEVVRAVVDTVVEGGSDDSWAVDARVLATLVGVPPKATSKVVRPGAVPDVCRSA